MHHISKIQEQHLYRRQKTAGYHEFLCGRIQGIFHKVRVVTASLQQHENVLQLQVDLGIQWALHVQYWLGATGNTGKEIIHCDKLCSSKQLSDQRYKGQDLKMAHYQLHNILKL